MAGLDEYFNDLIKVHVRCLFVLCGVDTVKRSSLKHSVGIMEVLIS